MWGNFVAERCYFSNDFVPSPYADNQSYPGALFTWSHSSKRWPWRPVKTQLEVKLNPLQDPNATAAERAAWTLAQEEQAKLHSILHGVALEAAAEAMAAAAGGAV